MDIREHTMLKKYLPKRLSVKYSRQKLCEPNYKDRGYKHYVFKKKTIKFFTMKIEKTWISNDVTSEDLFWCHQSCCDYV